MLSLFAFHCVVTSFSAFPLCILSMADKFPLQYFNTCFSFINVFDILLVKMSRLRALFFYFSSFYFHNMLENICVVNLLA